jgi:hypothetical protein
MHEHQAHVCIDTIHKTHTQDTYTRYTNHTYTRHIQVTSWAISNNADPGTKALETFTYVLHTQWKFNLSDCICVLSAEHITQLRTSIM